MAKTIDTSDVAEKLTRNVAAAENASQRNYVDDAARVHRESAEQARADQADKAAREEQGRRETTADYSRTK